MRRFGRNAFGIVRFSNLSKSQVQSGGELDQVGFDDAVRRVSNMNNRVNRCSFNAFDPSKAEDWADIVQVFNGDRVRIERVVRSFIDQSFKNSHPPKQPLNCYTASELCSIFNHFR